jgi:aerobic carbon-monoxide dehydrogenase medium subunit
MRTFVFTSPRTLAEASKLAGGDARILAGGQSLLPAMKLGLSAPEALVDLGRVASLKGISFIADSLVIGAMTTHAQVAAHPDVCTRIPALADLASRIGDRQVRNRGTIGGSLANNDPAACYPAAVLGLGASIVTDSRTIAADDFFKGLYATALGDGEIIESVRFPIPEKAAWQKFRQPASRFSIVGVFVSKGRQGVRVAVTGAGACVFRAHDLERLLLVDWSATAMAGATFPAENLNGDLHGSPEYRAVLIPVLARRAVECAS